MNRRTLLKAVALAGAASICPPTLFTASSASADSGESDAILRYLETLARKDGGYAWEDQEQSHLTPTYAVIGCYRAMGQLPPNNKALADFVRTHHPSRLKKLEQERRSFEFQQIQALVWLGADASELNDKIRAWTQPLPYLKQYERQGYPVFQSEAGAFACRKLLGLPLAELTPKFTDYLNSRRRENGSFNNTPASDGGDGHVMNTWWGLRALDTLGRARERKSETVKWLQACQLKSGGFTYQPQAEFGGNDDAGYTWAAIRALKLLDSAPAAPEACIAYLHSLANADNGFSDRPGWLSNPMATYYAVDALKTLNAALRSPSPLKGERVGVRGGANNARASSEAIAPRTATLPSNLKIFSMQIEAHGQGSPAEAVDLARSLRIHLWGAKNAKPEWLARAQGLADKQNVPVKFFVSDEEYGTWVNVPGLGTYSHTSDIIAPAGAEIGASLANKGTPSWPDFRERRLGPLMKAGGRVIWQFGENEELVRLYLDDSVNRGGYAAISTFHFGNPDFTNSEPFLHRWRGQIPYVALQDAHGSEPWWFSDMTTGFRTLFLASEPTWEAWLAALKNNWVVPVRHDVWSNHQTWMHSGSREVLELVRSREDEWRWWNNATAARPLVSMVAVRPEDQFETARPEKGLALRVRCAWQNNPQGLLKEPITELLKLTVDDVEVTPKLVTAKAPRGALLADHYHLHAIPALAAGKHTATATVRLLETKAEASRTITFEG